MGRAGRGRGRGPHAGDGNNDLPTGEVEVQYQELDVLSEAKELPLPVFGEPEYPEDTRLKYRFLDLRRETLSWQHHEAAGDHLFAAPSHADAGLLRIPDADPHRILAGRRARLPGAEPVHPGKFYALPQAPQQFKQLIMIAGFDRYFQIAPCFRDEDARADRSPGEFYQLDLEMSFVTQEDVFDTVEPILRGLFEEFGGGKPVTQKFPRIPYAEAMRKYGTDKPDLRNPIKMQDVTEHFRGSGFKVFAGMIDDGSQRAIWAIPAKGGGSRAVLRPDECLGARAGAARPRLYFLPRRRGGARADRQEYRPRADRGDQGAAWACRRRCRLLRGGIAGEFADFAAAPASRSATNSD